MMVAYRGMPKLTADEKKHLELILAQPCLTCVHQIMRTEAHHIVEGNRRLGPYYLLPLCGICHRIGPVNITYHRREFERLHGEQRILWELLMSTLGVMHTRWPESKIVPRIVA
jgi:hypothetical protein